MYDYEDRDEDDYGDDPDDDDDGDREYDKYIAMSQTRARWRGYYIAAVRAYSHKIHQNDIAKHAATVADAMLEEERKRAEKGGTFWDSTT